MNPKIYFISGVCGVGKTAVIPHLRDLLSAEKYDVRDFDERGVPDGADHAWRKEEVKKWIHIGTKAAQNGISTIICGFVKKSDFDKVIDEHTPLVETILLDADAESIRKRLIGRYSKNGVFDENQKVIGKSVNEFIESNVYYCDIMRKESKEEGASIIDTSHSTPAQVAERVAELVSK